MHIKMAKAHKNRASKQQYLSQNQLSLVGFETPFACTLSPKNRWVSLAHKIPWDLLVSTYLSQMGNSKTGADGINPRVAIGAMILKHMCDLTDRETVQQIQENIFMQYFIGYSSFSYEEPFDPSLFVEFRKHLGIEQINDINEKILGLNNSEVQETHSATGNAPQQTITQEGEVSSGTSSKEDTTSNSITHEGKLIVDATACPQDIAYPTDLNLLNDARKKSEELIDVLYKPHLHLTKPRTYRKVARKDYLHTAHKKVKSKKEIRKALRKQLNYLNRNLKSIDVLLDAYQTIPLNRYQHKYLFVIHTLYNQQLVMFEERIHSIDHRIVSIHQPHVRPIVRGKTNATVEKYKGRFGYYPEEVLVDKIYCNRSNRADLKTLGIKLRAKPLGRPKAVDVEHVRPGERNPIEGKFGQAKTAYGMNRIKARLQQTSQSWIATIVLVLNLVKLAGQVPVSLIIDMITFSADPNYVINI